MQTITTSSVSIPVIFMNNQHRFVYTDGILQRGVQQTVRTHYNKSTCEGMKVGPVSPGSVTGELTVVG